MSKMEFFILMDRFYKTHKYLIEHTSGLILRSLEQEIDWDKRIIGIKGARGIGKTSFLINYAQRHFDSRDKRCLYIDLNTFYFSTCNLIDFIRDFRDRGGRVLLLDQIYKYPNWVEELSICHNDIPDVQIIFTSSSVLSLSEEEAHLEKLVDFYNLRGLSFREYLNLELNLEFKAYSLDELLDRHEEIAKDIFQKINPLKYIEAYFHHGYYPLYLGKHSYSDSLLKMLNLMIEIDICHLKQLDVKYLPKLRKLFYLLAQKSPATINISKLSGEIETSRATALNYLKCLKDARLFNLLYSQGEEAFNKPERVYLENTNLIFLMNELSEDLKIEDPSISETFFYNSLHKDHNVKLLPGKQLTLEVDERYSFEVRVKTKGVKHTSDYLVVNNKECGKGSIIPLWIFGFLY